MPVKSRVTKDRRPTFSTEAIALFVELEAVPPQRRDSQTFKNQEHELARRLGLVSEWWTCNSVLDRSGRPCNPPGYVAYQDWFRCRAVRRQLLAAIADREKAPAH
jgi:hypothetical protein